MLLPENWKYYNHAILPAISPRSVPDLSSVSDGSIWNKPYDNSILLARWTDHFDCPTETEWWYCIKDDVFDINLLNAKKRNNINRGIKNFDISVIDPMSRIDELWDVQQKAFLAYPPKYRPNNTKESFIADLSDMKDATLFIACKKDTGELCAYAMLTEHENWISFPVLKSNPEYERQHINAAIVAGVCEYFNDKIAAGKFICDGERNTLHETNFQSYLEYYFGFRKAYCCLHIAYRPSVEWIIRIARIMPGLIHKLSFISVFNKLAAILKMDEIVRKDYNELSEK